MSIYQKNILGGVCLMHILAGCATHHPVPDARYRLTTEHHIVEFVPAKRNPTDIWKTYYRVMRKDRSCHVREVASGFHGDSQSVLGYSKKNVRLIESTDGKRLLIEELIPNECWEVKNYILVSPSGIGQLDHTYLRVPEVPYEGTPDDPSTLLSLDGEVLTFRYANGRIESRLLKDIPKAPDPRDS